MEPPFHDLVQRLACLAEPFRELREGVEKALRIAAEDPEMALTRVRKVLEFVVREVYARRCRQPPGTQSLENLLQRLLKDGHLPRRQHAYANAVRELGNVGTHTFGERLTANDVHQSLAQLMPVLEWYLDVERPEAPHRPAAAPAGTPATAAGGRHILLVDDGSLQRLVAVRLLEKRGHAVVVAPSGNEALTLLGQQPFDLILIQGHVPGMEAGEFMAALRQRGSPVPVVGMTSDPECRTRCLEAGMVGCISRPVCADELPAALRHALQGVP
jgi:CheY-like chemotaxis protein